MDVKAIILSLLLLTKSGLEHELVTTARLSKKGPQENWNIQCHTHIAKKL